MLSANDNIYFDVTLLDDTPITPQPVSWQTSSASYSAPWSLGLGQNGYGNQADWTSSNSLSETDGAIDLKENIINSIEDFDDALKNQEIKEVSEDLIGVFYNQDDALYPTNLERAWAGSSDSLYTLLVLNQRYPGSTVENFYPGTQTSSYRISNITMQAMMRVVGFPFNGQGPASPLPGPITGPDIPVPNSYKLNFLVFSKNNQEFITTNPAGETVDAQGLNIEVPTIEHFFEFTNNPINGRSLSGQSAPGVPTVGPLPPEVLTRLQEKYTDAAVGLSKTDPIEVFSEISGISNLSSLLLYPDTVNDIYGLPVGTEGPDDLQNVQVYDAYHVPLENQQAALTNLQYGIYKEACDAIRGYYNTFQSPATNGQTTQTQIKNFFDDFVSSRLNIIAAEHNSENPNQTVISMNYDDLAVGLRALMALAYDASPLWTSYGIGFANAANPMVGKTLSNIQSSESFIDWFSGQEIQLKNIEVPSKSLIVTVEDPPTNVSPNLQINYTTDGWFELHTPPQPISGIQHVNPSDSDFTDNYTLSTHASGIYTNKTSTSSDTVDASGIPLLVGAPSLTPTDTVNIQGEQVEIKDLYPFSGSDDLLPSNFTTFISMAGGVDRVTGSDFADVIVGPSHMAPHGRLTVNAGAGDDLLAPGRGGSLVQLGSGADTVVFRRGDLFGTANFLDFQSGDGDRLCLGFGIEATVDINNPSTIILNDLFSAATKTLRLTPLTAESDAAWAEFAIQSIATSPQPGELNYIETHTFIDPALTDLSKYKLEVSTPINSDSMARNQLLRAGDKVSVALGGTSKIYTADVFNHAAPQKVGFVVNFETDGFTQLPLGLDPTISITPLRQPVDIDRQYFTGSPQMDMTGVIQANKGTLVGFQAMGINQSVASYMDIPGSSMYLFDNQVIHGVNTIGNLLGRVVELDSGVIGLFVNPDLDPTATLASSNTLWWKSADAPSYGGQQIEVFVSRRNGNLDTYDSIFTAPHSHHIKASEINTLVATAGQDYNFATAPNPPNIPFSTWKPIGGTQIAFMGGLANYLHTNNLDYDPSLPSNYYYAPVEVSIDDELPIDSGPGKINLSSSFSVFELQSYSPIELQNICNQLNTVSKDPDGYYDMPAGMPDAKFKGTRALVTGSQVVINGSGRINNWNIYSDLYYKFGAHNQIQGKDKTAHDDVASNVYYTIGSDILTVSSTHTPDPADHWKDSIIAASFTSAWPVIKGIGGVRLQDFDSIDIVSASGATLQNPADLRNQHPELQFKESGANLLNHKQLGAWNWQADGPQIAGWGSLIEGNFIHANDDSVKIGAPHADIAFNTVVQGKAGVALGTSYGYLNGGFAGSKVKGLYAHRIVTDNADVALATAWASPVPEYFYEQTTATNGVATTVPQTLTVENVFVPELQVEIAQPAQDVQSKGTIQSWDLHQISSGAAVDFRDSLRGFPFTTASSAPFQVDLGLINMHNNWEINTEVPTPNYVQLQNNNNWPNTKVIPSPPYSSYRNYQNAENSWAMAGAGGTVTVTQGNQNINLFSSHNDTRIKRPQLKRATKIRINRDSDVIGPQPVRMMYSQIKAAVSSNLGVSDDDSYVITEVASGKVEKKQGDSWVDVSTPPRSSNPFELLALLQRRIIKPTDEIRWVPDAKDKGEVSTEAFELIGWNGSSASEEKTSIEIDASGWSDL